MSCPASYSRELAELIFIQPYWFFGNVVETGISLSGKPPPRT